MNATDTVTMPACPRCGKTLPTDAPAGLCPACLLSDGFGFGSHADTDSPNPNASHRPRGFTPPTVEEIALEFPHLQIERLIGSGGMGAVYLAKQIRLDRHVAVKILPPEYAEDPAFAERFLREARALARLGHPNIVQVHDFGLTPGGLFYFLMEYVEGTTLRQVIATKSATPNQALEIVRQVCDALQFAHDKGIVHRDIKPENILLDSSGRPKIADFGLAKLLGIVPDEGNPAAQSLTATRQAMGTPHYIAPEQLVGSRSVDHRADIYSLGVVFYELLTGELPLGRFEPPSHLASIDVRLDEVVLKALEVEPERRYQSVSAVKQDVEQITGTPIPQAAPKSRTASTSIVRPTYLPRFSGLAFGGGLFVLGGIVALLAGSVEFFTRPTHEEALLMAVGLALLAFLIAATSGFLGFQDIQQSEGRLAGLGLAIISILSLPIAVLSTVIYATIFVAVLFYRASLISGSWSQVLSVLREDPSSHLMAALFAAPLCLITGWMLSQRVWQHVTVSAPSNEARLSAKAVAGIVVLGLLVLIELIWGGLHGLVSHTTGDRFGEFALAALVFFPPSIILFGLFAAQEIRKSNGQLHGRVLATIELLLFPILLLNVILFFGVLVATLPLQSVMQRDSRELISWIVALTLAPAVCIIADVSIIRLVWRALWRPSRENENGRTAFRSPAA